MIRRKPLRARGKPRLTKDEAERMRGRVEFSDEWLLAQTDAALGWSE